MPSKSHTEFEYRYMVNGHTIWEKIKILKGFLDGRIRASKLEVVGLKRYQAKISKLEYLKDTSNLNHEILELEADILENESFHDEAKILYEMNKEEILLLKNLLKEAYEIAEPTRVNGYSDEQMFDLNSANEFTVMIGKQLQSEIIANGRPSPSTLFNAMSNPHTFNALKLTNLIPEDAKLLGGNNDPLYIELKPI